MSFKTIALKCNIDENDLQELVYGNVTIGIEKKLGAPQESLQNFVYGDVDDVVSEKFNLSKDELQFLRYQKGGDGAIGMLIGLLLSK
jgi:hypothetical protein